MTQKRDAERSHSWARISRISLLPCARWMPITADEYGLREHWLCARSAKLVLRDRRNPVICRAEEKGDVEGAGGRNYPSCRDESTLISFAGPNTPYLEINFARTGLCSALASLVKPFPPTLLLLMYLIIRWNSIGCSFARNACLTEIKCYRKIFSSNIYRIQISFNFYFSNFIRLKIKAYSENFIFQHRSIVISFI